MINNTDPLSSFQKTFDDITHENIAHIARGDYTKVDAPQYTCSIIIKGLKEELGDALDLTKVKIRAILDHDAEGSYLIQTYRSGSRHYCKIGCTYQILLPNNQKLEFKDTIYTDQEPANKYAALEFMVHVKKTVCGLVRQDTGIAGKKPSYNNIKKLMTTAQFAAEIAATPDKALKVVSWKAIENNRSALDLPIAAGDTKANYAFSATKKKWGKTQCLIADDISRWHWTQLAHIKVDGVDDKKPVIKETPVLIKEAQKEEIKVILPEVKAETSVDPSNTAIKLVDVPLIKVEDEITKDENRYLNLRSNTMTKLGSGYNQKDYPHLNLLSLACTSNGKGLRKVLSACKDEPFTKKWTELPPLLKLLTTLSGMKDQSIIFDFSDKLAVYMESNKGFTIDTPYDQLPPILKLYADSMSKEESAAINKLLKLDLATTYDQLPPGLKMNLDLKVVGTDPSAMIKIMQAVLRSDDNLVSWKREGNEYKITLKHDVEFDYSKTGIINAKLLVKKVIEFSFDSQTKTLVFKDNSRPLTQKDTAWYGDSVWEDAFTINAISVDETGNLILHNKITTSDIKINTLVSEKHPIGLDYLTKRLNKMYKPHI